MSSRPATLGQLKESGWKSVSVKEEIRRNAARNGVAIGGAELYTTASPCWPCFKLIANAGISKVYYGEFYRDERSLAVAREAGIELVDLGDQRIIDHV